MRLKLLALCFIASAILAGPTQSARPTAIILGDSGKRVAALQWLLGGHHPNVFRKVKGTYTAKPNGLFGQRTAAAVVAYKWRLGYPSSLVRPVAGTLFFDLVLGHKTRPPSWIALAAHRLQAVEPGATKLALRIKAYEITQLGVSEHPLGSNYGLQVSIYQSATGAYHAAWCVSFQQYSFWTHGPGRFANNTASVYYELDYYAARNRVFARPKVGALVAFVSYDSHGRRIAGTGHTGYVAKVLASGFVSIEGNASNRVLERFHPWRDTGRTWRETAFIYLPGVA